MEEDGREPGGLSEGEEESACGGYGIGWSLWYSDKQDGRVGETERAWGDREKVRRDEESACGVDVDVMVAMI